MSDDLYVKTVEPQDPRLGRQVVHDPQSRNFPRVVAIDKSTWRDKVVRLYDPWPNPNQTIGNCTGCGKAMEFNAIGNRITGSVLKMPDADKIYSLATGMDPWEGSWPPTDTGSSGLAAAKAAVQLGLGGEYRWHFGGADEVVQSLMGDEHQQPRVVNIGSWWHWDMFRPDANGVVRPTGGYAGGHQWIVRGYDVDRDLVMGRCWWGEFKDFWISRADLDTLLRDDGDAHTQVRIAA